MSCRGCQGVFNVVVLLEDLDAFLEGRFVWPYACVAMAILVAMVLLGISMLSPYEKIRRDTSL